MGKRLTIALAVFALLAVPLGAYAGGYFWLGERRERHWRDGLAAIERTYPQPWLAEIYRPAGQVEEWLSGVRVQIEGR